MQCFNEYAVLGLFFFHFYTTFDHSDYSTFQVRCPNISHRELQSSMSELKPVAQSKSSNNNNDQRVMAWLVATNSKCNVKPRRHDMVKKIQRGMKQGTVNGKPRGGGDGLRWTSPAPRFLERLLWPLHPLRSMTLGNGPAVTIDYY